MEPAAKGEATTEENSAPPAPTEADSEEKRVPSAAARPEARSPGATIRGKLTGPAAGEVKAVLVLGPDNLLREAARVAPSSHGSWSAGVLSKGTYRIIVDAGGNRVASTDPPFVTVTVDQDPMVDAPDLRVVSIRTP